MLPSRTRGGLVQGGWAPRCTCLGVQSYPFSGNLLKGGLGAPQTPPFLQQNLTSVHRPEIGFYASRHPF